MAEVKEAKTVQRWDSLDPGRWMTTPFAKTPEGFFSGRAIVTSVGVFTYQNRDGTLSRELRLPEEVFAEDSLSSMKLKPLVNGHPTEEVTADNARIYQVGSLGNNPSDWMDSYSVLKPAENINYRGLSGTDGFHVAIDLTVTDAATIAEVEAGRQALSMGYKCDLEPAPSGSTWCGIAYDGIQRKIRYNHCAIVDVARAGDAARIRMDSADAVRIYQPGETPKPNQEVGKMAMKKINLDGVDYEGEEKLIEFYQTQKKRADAAEQTLETARADHAKALSQLTAERDALKDRADKAEKEAKEAKALAADPKRIDEAVKEKVALYDAADRAGVEVKDSISDMDIKKAVITAVAPAAKLDGKDDVYIQARFDAAVEELESIHDGRSREVIGGTLPQAPASRNDSRTAYQKMVDRMKARSRGEKAEG
jgi:hypothetical protein